VPGSVLFLIVTLPLLVYAVRVWRCFWGLPTWAVFLLLFFSSLIGALVGLMFIFLMGLLFARWALAPTKSLRARRTDCWRSNISVYRGTRLRGILGGDSGCLIVWSFDSHRRPPYDAQPPSVVMGRHDTAVGVMIRPLCHRLGA